MRCRMPSGTRLSDPNVEAPSRDMPQRTRTTRHRTGTMRIFRVRCRVVTIRCGIVRRRCRVVRREAATDRYLAASPETTQRWFWRCRIVSVRRVIVRISCGIISGDAARDRSDAASSPSDAACHEDNVTSFLKNPRRLHPMRRFRLRCRVVSGGAATFPSVATLPKSGEALAL